MYEYIISIRQARRERLTVTQIILQSTYICYVQNIYYHQTRCSEKDDRLIKGLIN